MPIIATKEMLDKETYTDKEVAALIQSIDRRLAETARDFGSLVNMIYDQKDRRFMVVVLSWLLSVIAVLSVTMHIISERLETPQPPQTQESKILSEPDIFDCDSPVATGFPQEFGGRNLCRLYSAIHNTEDGIGAIHTAYCPLCRQCPSPLPKPNDHQEPPIGFFG
jgi:hypothetical protein